MSDLEKYMDDSTLDALTGSNEGQSETVEESNDTSSEIEEVATSSEEVPESGETATLEQQLEGLESKEGESSSVLDQINDLGVIRHGTPVEFDSIDNVKELLSKGYDYTAKTQELADHRKEFEGFKAEQEQVYEQKMQEVEAFKQEHQERLVENDVMGQVLSELQQNDPDLFNTIANAYQSRMGLIQSQQNNPVIKGFEQKINQLESALKGNQEQKVNEENSQILEQWESGISEVQKSFGTKLRSLGVKPNWEKVKQSWSADSSGATSVKEAFFAIHGDQITKALEAKSKLNATKAKSQTRQGPAKTTGAPQSDQANSKNGHGTYLNDLEAIANRYL